MNRTGLLLVGGALVGAMGSAAAADRPLGVLQAPVSGEVGLYAGATHWDWAGYGSPVDGTVLVLGGEAKANVWTRNQAWSLQFDASSEGTSAFSLTGSDNAGRIQGVLGVHASSRNANRLLGGFLGVSANNNLDDSGQMAHGIVGVEGQHYGSMWTFYYQAGYFGRISGSDVNEPLSLWFGRAAVRYFPSPATMLSGEFDFATGPTQGNGYTAFIYAWRAEVEHMLPGSRWAVFGRYDGNHAYSNYDTVSGASTEHQVVVGGKMMFGQPSLLARDRHGATLDMPAPIIRALPYSYVWYF